MAIRSGKNANRHERNIHISKLPIGDITWNSLHPKYNCNVELSVFFEAAVIGFVFIGGKTMRCMSSIYTVVGLVLTVAISHCFSAEVASIHEAASLGILDKVKVFLEDGIDVNAKDSQGMTPLLLAAQGGHKDVAELLINRGADVNGKDNSVYIPLSWAIWNEDRDMIKLLVTNSADVNFVAEDDWPFLHYLTWNNDRELVELFLAHGAKLNVKDKSGQTEFHIAVLRGNRDLSRFLVSKGATAPELHLAACLGDLARVKSLVEEGVDVDTKDEIGWTPLYWAASTAEEEVAEFLIGKGADIDVRTNNDRTPLQQAATAGAAKLTSLLISKGADSNARDEGNGTPLHSAAAGGHKNVVELLITNGAEVNAKDKSGDTPLHKAAIAGHGDVVEVLLAKGADVNIKNRRGLTALDWAMRRDHTELVELLLVNESAASAALVSATQSGDQKSVAYLLDRGADVNYQDDFGLSPLHVAASTQDSNCVSLLLKRGAKVNVRDKAGRTPLHYAVGARRLPWEPKDGDIEAAKLLLDHGADINITDKEDKTPLFYSIRLGEKMTELLLNRGADPNYVDPRGEKPLPSKQGCIFFVGADGDDSNFGTREHPLKTIYTAVMIARPGDTIYVRGGRYSLSHTVQIDKSGRQNKPICLYAYPGETPILDFSTTAGYGFIIRGAYWHIKDIVITNSGNEGIHLVGEEAHHNILEQITTNSCSRTGICVTGKASHNLILNCDAYRNFEFLANGENGGGFVANFSAGIGNVLIGDRAWNNSDDGYDFWHSGNAVRLESCYSWRNGENIWSHPFFKGNGNGFKLGQMEGAHLLIRCVAWDHPWRGFDLNGNSTGVTLHHCTAFRNRIDFAFMFSKGNIEKNVLRSNLSHKGSIQIPQKVDDRLNSWNVGIEISDGDFLSLDDSMMTKPRNPDGSIPQNDFLKLTPGSKAIDKGVDVGMPFVGVKPDLGAFEYDPNDASSGYVKMLHQAVRDHDVKQVEQLLAQGEGINDKDWLGYAPLHWAVYFGYPDLIELLISKGADPDIQSNTGRYALEIARAMAYPELEALLRKLGAKAGDVSTN
jgi:ankyrin repeat protein